MNGVHIVLDRSSVVRMNSATNGVPVNSPDGYDELVYWDVHISDSGEYVHAAPWSTTARASRTCRTAASTSAPRTRRRSSRSAGSATSCSSAAGPGRRAVGDHGVMDWDTAWNEFTPANAILQVPSGSRRSCS